MKGKKQVYKIPHAELIKVETVNVIRTSAAVVPENDSAKGPWVDTQL